MPFSQQFLRWILVARFGYHKHCTCLLAEERRLGTRQLGAGVPMKMLFFSCISKIENIRWGVNLRCRTANDGAGHTRDKCMPNYGSSPDWFRATSAWLWTGVPWLDARDRQNTDIRVLYTRGLDLLINAVGKLTQESSLSSRADLQRFNGLGIVGNDWSNFMWSSSIWRTRILLRYDKRWGDDLTLRFGPPTRRTEISMRHIIGSFWMNRVLKIRIHPGCVCKGYTMGTVLLRRV